MPVFEHRFSVAAPVRQVAAFHRSADSFRRLIPPGIPVCIRRPAVPAEGAVAEFTLWIGPLPVRWTALHRDVSDSGFTDVQTAGPLKQWIHQHRFEAADENRTVVIDRIELEHASGVRGLGTRLLFSRLSLRLMFLWRMLVTRRACRQAGLFGSSASDCTK